MSDPIRVGFVIDTLASGAGTENQLILILRRLDRERVEPSLCCLWDSPELGDLDLGCPVEVLGFNRLWSPRGLAGLRSFRSWIRKRRLELVVTFFRDANVVGVLGAVGTGARVLSSRRNLGKGYWHTGVELAKLRALNRLAAGFIANSQAARDYTADVEGVSREKIEVIYNAVDTERFRPPATVEQRLAFRKEAEMPASSFLVGCVSNLRWIKGVDVLVEAWAGVVRTLPEARLLLVGEGGERSALEGLAAELGIDSTIRFLGRRQDVPGILRALDLGVLPSRGESFPNTLLEFMASGVPPVASDVGGTGELIRSADLGTLVPPEDPAALSAGILEIGRDEERRKAMALNVRRHVIENHEIPVILDHWVQFLIRCARGNVPA